MTRQDNIFVREVTLDDLKYTQEAVDVVNAAYSTEAGWTSESSIVHGDRAASDEIEKSIRESGVSCRLLFAFDVVIDEEKQQEKTVVVGTLRIEPGPDSENEKEGEIRLFSVHPSYQSRGVGGRLVRYALARMSEIGYTQCVMRVFESRHELIAWYKRLGFEEIGTKDFHKQEILKWQDRHLFLVKKL